MQDSGFTYRVLDSGFGVLGVGSSAYQDTQGVGGVELPQELSPFDSFFESDPCG